MSVSRRSFLQSVTVSMAGSVLLPYSMANQNVVPYAAGTAPKTVIFQDKAIFYDNEMLEAYLPAVKPAESTRKYVSSLSETEFLSRHWFV